MMVPKRPGDYILPRFLSANAQAPAAASSTTAPAPRLKASPVAGLSLAGPVVSFSNSTLMVWSALRFVKVYESAAFTGSPSTTRRETTLPSSGVKVMVKSRPDSTYSSLAAFAYRQGDFMLHERRVAADSACGLAAVCHGDGTVVLYSALVV